LLTAENVTLIKKVDELTSKCENLLAENASLHDKNAALNVEIQNLHKGINKLL
jgi:cell division protein FtsB